MDATNIELKVFNCSGLSDKIWLKILSFLPKRDRRTVSLVSERFEQIILYIELRSTKELKITENNVKKIRTLIENKNMGKLSFKTLQLENIKNIEDTKLLLESIGIGIDHLSIKGTAVFESLKGNLINIKSLELNFDVVLKANIAHLNLCVFPLLENLVFLNNAHMADEAKTLLSQLIGPKKTLHLRFFELECSSSFEDELVKVLLLHGDKLETLNIHFRCEPKSNWENVWLCMKNLRNLILIHHLTLILNTIFNKLSKENPLECLFLNGSGILDSFLSLIVEKWMDSLKQINLCNFLDITDVGIMELRKLRKLCQLKIHNCNKITNTGLLMGIALEQNCIMRSLELNNLSKMDELGLRVLASRLPNLLLLRMDEMEKSVTNTSLASIFRFQTNLCHLNISNCFEITDEGLIGYGNYPHSIKNLSQLNILHMDGCYNLTDRTLIEALHLPKLQELYLGNCHKITSKGIEALVNNCPKLVNLKLSSIVMVDDIALLAIGNGLKCLQELTLTNCANLSNALRDHITDGFNTLKDSMPNDCKLILED